MTRPRLAALAAGLALLAAAPAAGAATPAQSTWHAEQARVADARTAGRGGEGVVVAVLDSWVDAAHPDFGGRVLPGADCVGGTCTAGAPTPDQCDHGTHVAGTVASSSFGVAPRASVLPVRVLSYDPTTGECVGRPDDVTAAIRWAVAHGARVINLSLGPDVPGLSASSSIPRAVTEAAEAGVVVVFSAGNASLPVADAYGGSALIVAATGPDGSLASYSQRGAGVDLAAPGGDPRQPDVCTREDCVTSLFPGNRYSVAAGTSMAAPHVAGTAALLLAQDPSRTDDQVVERLLSTARPLAQAGRGSLDARAALGGTATPPPARARTTAAPEPVVVRPTPSAPPAPSPVAPAAQPPVPLAVAPAPPLAQPSAPASAPPPPVTAQPGAVAPPLVPAEQAVPAWTAALATALALGVGSGAVLASRSARR